MIFIKEELDTSNNNIIAIDFDGTLTCTNEFPIIGDLREEANYFINKWYQEGFYIIIWTCRSEPKDLEPMKDFLKIHKIPYHKINENIDELNFKPYPKIFANWYLDDRSLTGFPGFRIADEIIHEKASISYNILVKGKNNVR